MENVTLEMINVELQKYVDVINARQSRVVFELPTVEIVPLGTTAGDAIGHHEKSHIRLNADLINQNWEEFKTNIIAHEFAHIVVHKIYDCFACNYKGQTKIKAHGKEWKNIMRVFGVEATTKHTLDCGHVKSKLKQHVYVCNCNSHKLTSIRHNRVLKGQIYHCAECGASLTFVKSL